MSCYFEHRPFSVGPNKRVYFSPGNLQFLPAKEKTFVNEGMWRFADEQFRIIGSAYAGDDRWMDLFEWGTGDCPIFNFEARRYYLFTYDTKNFVDWGNNIIEGDEANTWRTLSKAEWEYLLLPRHTHPTYVSMINGVKGLVIFPDNFFPDNPMPTRRYSMRIEEWHKLEKLGVVFLPIPNIDGNDKAHGGYWSSSSGIDLREYNPHPLLYDRGMRDIVFSANMSKVISYEVNGGGAFAELFTYNENCPNDNKISGQHKYMCNAYSVRLVRDIK